MTTMQPNTSARLPAPFTPASVEFRHRGKLWRITVKRYWLIPVHERYRPDMLVWTVERTDAQGAMRHVGSDSVPLAVAKRASAFFNAVAT